MRALTLTDTLRFQTDYSEPARQVDEALIRVRLAGVCNTDLELVKGYMGFSGVLGHEFVGEVVEGDSAWAGRRVVGEINVACGACDLCHRGLPTQCRHRTTLGIDRKDGVIADRVTLVHRNLHVVPDRVSDRQAVFVEPLAAAFQVLESIHLSPHDRVVVVGAGKLGLLCAQVVKLSGADLSVVVRREAPAKLLNQWGIRAVSYDELPAKRTQVVIDCTGNQEGLIASMNLVEPRGTIVLKSTYATHPTINLSLIAVDEIRVIGSRCGPFPAAIRALEAGLIDVESMIDAVYPLDRALEAMQRAAQPGALKVLLEV